MTKVCRGPVRRHKPQERRDGGMEGQDGWRDEKARQTQSLQAPAERTAVVPLSSKPHSASCRTAGQTSS